MPDGDQEALAGSITNNNVAVDSTSEHSFHAKRIHWLAPTSMVAFLVLGSLFAVGHHLFYQSLDGSSVSPSTYAVLGTHFSSQQLNTSVGTIFAFLVKACMGASISIAFAQLFWKTLISPSPSRPLKLSMVDAAFSGSTSIGFLLAFQLWIRYRLMFALAIIAWLIAVPSVITPGTLTVRIDNRTSAGPAVVPYLNFTQLNYVSQMSENPDSGIGLVDPDLELYIYDGPSQAVSKVVSAAVGQDSILPIASPPLNSSWAMEYPGPYLDCTAMESDRSLRVQQSIADFALAYNQYDCYTPYAYISWYGDLPFVKQDANTTAPTTATLLSSTDNATISFAIMPAMLSNLEIATQPGLNPSVCYKLPEVQGNSSSNPLGSMGVNASFIQCQLFNSSYHTEFEYSGGVQNINTNIIQTPPKTPIVPVENVQSNSRSDSVDAAGDGPCLVRAMSGDGSTPISMQNCSIFDLSVLQTLSYQAVMDAFGGHFTGDISPLQDFAVVQNSSVLTTPLSEAAELSFLTNALSVNQNDTIGDTLQQTFLLNFGVNSSGIPSSPAADAVKQNFSNIMEQLFMNVTVGLMSSKDLASRVPDDLLFRTSVSITTAEQVYIYVRGRLWLAYGLGILFTSVAVIIGLAAIWSNDASYSDSFSSILRVARRIELSAEITDADADGRDPLPEHLATATLVMLRPSEAEKEIVVKKRHSTRSVYTSVSGDGDVD